MIRRRRAEDTADAELFDELIAVLLGGWGAETTTAPSDDAFRIFDVDLQAVWHRHRQRLLDEAKKRGVPRPVYAEAVFDCHSWPKDLDELRERLLVLLDGPR